VMAPPLLLPLSLSTAGRAGRLACDPSRRTRPGLMWHRWELHWASRAHRRRLPAPAQATPSTLQPAASSAAMAAQLTRRRPRWPHLWPAAGWVAMAAAPLGPPMLLRLQPRQAAQQRAAAAAACRMRQSSGSS
jgi:hypothetical protein